MTDKFVVRYRIRLAGRRFSRWTFVRPEFAPNDRDHATRFDDGDAVHAALAPIRSDLGPSDFQWDIWRLSGNATEGVK